MPLARQTYNPGTNFSNARYDVRNLQRGERGFTDGQFWYDENGLSLDRPDAVVQGLRPANQMDDRAAWDSGIGPGGGGTSHPAGGFSRAPSGGAGQLPWFGYEGQASADQIMQGTNLGSAREEQDDLRGADPVAAALAELVAKVPGRTQPPLRQVNAQQNQHAKDMSRGLPSVQRQQHAQDMSRGLRNRSGGRRRSVPRGAGRRTGGV